MRPAYACSGNGQAAELSPEQRLEAVRGFVSAELVSRGMVADIAIHTGRTASDGAEQPHAHVMLTLRGSAPRALQATRCARGTRLQRWRGGGSGGARV